MFELGRREAAFLVRTYVRLRCYHGRNMNHRLKRESDVSSEELDSAVTLGETACQEAPPL